jgi:Protein of unknown function (DUF742)
VSPDDLDHDAAGEPSLVRPYALVRGRTRRGSAAPLPVEAIIVTELSINASALQLEPAAIVRLCRRPYSVAEVSALLGVPVGVVRVLVADLSAEGYVQVNLPLDPGAGDTVDRGLLERVLAGLEAL